MLLKIVFSSYVYFFNFLIFFLIYKHLFFCPKKIASKKWKTREIHVYILNSVQDDVYTDEVYQPCHPRVIILYTLPSRKTQNHILKGCVITPKTRGKKIILKAYNYSQLGYKMDGNGTKQPDKLFRLRIVAVSKKERKKHETKCVFINNTTLFKVVDQPPLTRSE